MNKVLILISKHGNHLDWIVNLFHQNCIHKQSESLNSTSSMVMNELSQKHDCSSVLSNDWKYFYKNNEITIKFYNGNFDNHQSQNYDKKFYIYTSLLQEQTISNIQNVEGFETIIFSHDEISEFKDDEIVDICNDKKIKIITNSLNSKERYIKNHVYYDPYLSCISSFYLTNYNWLSFEKRKSYREELVSSYYKKNHRKERDIVFEQLENFLHKRNQRITVKDYLYNYIDEVKKIQFHDKIYKNRGYHTTTFTDYINSVVTLYFETHLEISNFYISEKTMKSFLFSNVGVIPVLVNDKKTQKLLIDDGFWAMNFDFYDEDFQGNSLEYITSNLQKTFEHILHIYLNDGKKNYEKTYQILYEQNKDKLNQNTEKMLEICENFQDKKDLIDFILI